MADAGDPHDMLAHVRDSPAQWVAAARLAEDVPDSLGGGRPRGVVVCGLGGSGIVGDVAALLAAEVGPIPVVAVKGYRLPAWVGPDSLVVIVSHSGQTEETLACLAQAREVGARLAGVTSGGRLAELLAAEDAPTVVVPGHLPPRASLPYLAVPTLKLLETAGVLPGALAGVATLPDHLTACRRRWDEAGRQGPAAMAARLTDLTPWFVGGRGVGALVALRARCQMNENAERVAFSSELPELDHNTVVGWAGRRGMPGPTALIAVRDPEERERVDRRFPVTAEVAGRAFVRREEILLSGTSLLERLAVGFLYVDLLSVHVALADGIDPTPVDVIDELKARLREEVAG